MQSKSLADKILNDANLEANKINEETNNLVNKIKSEELTKIESHYKNLLDNAIKNADVKVNSLDKQLTTEVEAFKRQAKYQVVESIFNEILTLTNKLEGPELCNFVFKLVNNDEITGSESIVVDLKDYNKYLIALSSKKDPNNLDLLNVKSKNFNFRLVGKKLNFDNGFLLENSIFDMIFDFKEIMKTYQKEYEKEVYKELFDNE